MGGPPLRHPGSFRAKGPAATACTISQQMHRLLVAALAAWVPVAAQSPEHLGKTLESWSSGLAAPAAIDRLLAVRSIGEMAIAGQNGAAEELLSAMSHEDSGVRYWAAAAAIRLPALPASGLPVLREALEDEAPEVRVQAAHALIQAGEARAALDALAALLSHANRGVRLQAAHAADAIGDRAAPLADALRAALDDEFDYVRRVSRHALWTLGERPCPYQDCE